MNDIDTKERFPLSFDGVIPQFEKAENPAISYILSTYNRPLILRIVLASLQVQSDSNLEVIVVDNSTDEAIIAKNKAIIDELFNDPRFSYINTQMKTCYHSSAYGAEQAIGRYVCFPSDDSYYVPVFQECMLELADRENLGFAYSGILYNGFHRSHVYASYPSRPVVGHIDKTQYIIRRELFDGFAMKDTERNCSADGYVVADLVQLGIPYAKHEGVLVVHN
jgi:glycosyltransferase involved in cell wall biosynthesis